MLRTVAIASLVVALLCVAIVAIDILRGHRQPMGVMNFVWVLTPLYSGLVGLWAYYRLGRPMAKAAGKMDMDDKKGGAKDGQQYSDMDMGPKKPFWQSVALGAMHCGSGCSLGDLLVETFVLYVPLVLFGHAIFGAWVLDYLVAFLIGIIFQYYAIAPMRHLGVKEGLKAAVKADTLSLTSWQIGMYGWMAIATFLIFGHELKANDPVFWFMMQLAMVLGFLTAYPVNWWLIKSGVKERM
ncbi:DUF4396 domain-containing protein [Hymenobacter sp. RP-2-7]|uniref:DUF4396 domain-containing protein n=1 Tax=Hymenobacter polaris TaxID=2682546 RepID=A0A7Y0AFI8_9BACT|nr:DUF4396 domain-containing protein [Hymenobacter polaris]NML66381.1 DUF4396 domain-containing protein [Hymenobacter polaris]